MADMSESVRLAHARYTEANPLSAEAHRRACRVLPGGNTRSVLQFEPFPFRVQSAAGASLVDVDGHSYLDLCGNYTAGFLGHNPTGVGDAITGALKSGWALGATHETEIELAELLCDRFDSLDMVRFTNSGTEANLMAIATALHHTGRSTVGVFDHGYHGGVLSFSGLDNNDTPMNVPHRFVKASFNDLIDLDRLFDNPDMGCVLWRRYRDRAVAGQPRRSS